MDLILLILTHLIPISLTTTIFLSLTGLMILRLAPHPVVLLLTSAWIAWKLSLKRASAPSRRRSALLP